MREFIFVRHGLTEWNASHRFQGQTDVPLNDRGRMQARAVARALRSESIDAVYSSDLSRALETARMVAKPHKIDVVTEARLREFDFGTWEGLTWDEIVATRPHLRDQQTTAARRYTPEGGESFEAVRERVASFFDELETRGAQGRIAIVTHAGPLHAALAVLSSRMPSGPIEPIGISFAPGGVTRITMEAGVARLITLNDLRHLDSARRP
jgi:broad specificity phosphatase PhoE